MIKKLTALLMSLLMLCSFAAAETVDYSGTWYLVSIESEGVVLNPADIGMAMTMSLDGDGTGMITITDEEDQAVTWTRDGETITITAEDESLVFVPTDDGKLIADAEGSIMTFGRETPGPGFVPASEIAAIDIAEFDGTWNITKVNAYGMVVPFSAMAEMGMIDGTVLILSGSITSFGAAEAEAGTLTDGKLIVPSPIEGSFGKSISLLEDGTLSVEYMEMIFYCEKAVTTE
ncbi:MAG: hypothetical protein ABIG45_04270 [Bacillota bacterium]